MSVLDKKPAETLEECPLARSPDCPLRILNATPVEQWFRWMLWFLEALSECAPRKEYEHFLRDLERLISFRLNNGSWEPDQDSE